MRMSQKFSSTIVAGAALLLLAGCQTPPPPPPTAVLEVTGKPCDDQVSLLNAESLTPKKAKSWWDVATVVDETAHCVLKDDVAVNYAIYALPDHPTNHVLTVGGVRQQLRTLAPTVSILGADGETKRTFDAEAYRSLGGAYAVQFQPREAERFVLVETDLALVGNVKKVFEARLVQGQGYASGPYGGGAYYTTFSGKETSTSRTFSHEGVISIRIQAISGKIGTPGN